MRNIFAASAAILILSCSCSRDKAVVSGRIGASDKETVYLEKIMPGNSTITDSTTTDSNGRFRFKVSGIETPIIYNVRDKDGFIALLLSSGEDVTIDIPAKTSGEYSVQGSEGSERMQTLRKIMASGKYKLDSIRSAFDKADPSERRAISTAYAKQYYASKQEQIKFIIADPGSIASLYALYQQLPSDRLVSNANDIIYFRTVADSAGARYPSSPYVATLRETIKAMESKRGLSDMITDKMSNETTKYPDIELNDIYGKKHRLSDLDGKVIVLDFWTTDIPNSAINNAEMKAIYTKYADQGLEIYQVSLDGVKHAWVSAVTTQQLPWISVNDPRGAMSTIVGRYNIKSLPANFIIGRDGNITGKDLFGKELEKKIKELI